MHFPLCLVPIIYLILSSSDNSSSRNPLILSIDDPDRHQLKCKMSYQNLASKKPTSCILASTDHNPMQDLPSRSSLTTPKITSRDSLQNCCASTTCFKGWVCHGPAKLRVDNFGYALGARGYLLPSCTLLGTMQDELSSTGFMLPCVFILLLLLSKIQESKGGQLEICSSSSG